MLVHGAGVSEDSKPFTHTATYAEFNSVYWNNQLLRAMRPQHLPVYLKQILGMDPTLDQPKIAEMAHHLYMLKKTRSKLTVSAVQNSLSGAADFSSLAAILTKLTEQVCNLTVEI